MVRVRSRPLAACGGAALVLVDVEPAAERSITVAADFITVPPGLTADYAAELADDAYVAELTEAAIEGVLDALIKYEYRTGPLKVVLVQHHLHPVDTGYATVRGAAARAVRQAIELLPHRMVAEWVTFTPDGPVVRLTNPVRAQGRYGGRDTQVTIEVAPAPQCTVVMGAGFAASAANRLYPADVLARAEQVALAAAHLAVERHEDRVGPLHLTLLGHRPGDFSADSAGAEYEIALDAGVRMAVEQLEFALSRGAGHEDQSARSSSTQG
ncbi:hypothetical protein ACFQY4_35735 [Catellatospora bangladeshensis]|uniref:Uncharacterized protein n=1 Tax=Catellatospora bangladeshensis TaxID=310355 RepID=A0A8J3JB51_9ACTN|nr:hypothetical protein [Catellatospora bangladeshensis]GIF80991.1 hypothetical protein Cba03nite_23400 [Catellatospora bangladeshensis]